MLPCRLPSKALGWNLIELKGPQPVMEPVPLARAFSKRLGRLSVPIMDVLMKPILFSFRQGCLIGALAAEDVMLRRPFGLRLTAGQPQLMLADTYDFLDWARTA